MGAADPARWLNKLEISLVVVASAAACMTYTAYLGLDVNWDLRNYHFYSVYALLHGRHDVDIAPGQMQTWFNPVGQIFNYLLIRKLNPFSASMIMAAVAGMNVACVYFLTRTSASSVMKPALAVLISTLAATGAFVSPMFLSEVGTSFNDTNTGLLILVALLLILRSGFEPAAIAAAGFAIGLAVGIKLTAAIFAVGIAAAFLSLPEGRSAKTLAILVGAAVLAYIPSGGLWNLYLWGKFGNPTFPLLNNIFHSPDFLPLSLTDDRFRPKTLSEALEFAPKWALMLYPTAELPFRDTRFLLLGILSFVAAPALLAGEDRKALLFKPDHARFLGVFAIATFALWLKLYGIQRYIVPLEQIAVLLMLLVVDRLILKRGAKIVSFAVATLFVVCTTSPTDWGRIPFGANWMQATFPESLASQSVLHIMVGSDPISYVAVSAPQSHVFVRIDGNLKLADNVGLRAKALRRIAEHTGEVRSMSVNPPNAAEDALLRSFGLSPVQGDCIAIRSAFEVIQSCGLKRSEAAQTAATP